MTGASRARQAAEARAPEAWAEPCVWTKRMLATLETGVRGDKWSTAGQTPSSRSTGCSPALQPVRKPPIRANGNTIDWRAVCGRSACTVRREGRRNSMRRPYPYVRIRSEREPELSFALSLSTKSRDKVWGRSVADKAWRQGVGTKCKRVADKAWRQGVGTKCKRVADKAWRQGVGTKCKRGAHTLNPLLNPLLIGTLHPPAYSIFVCIRPFTAPFLRFSRFSRLKNSIHSRPFAFICGSVSPHLCASVPL